MERRRVVGAQVIAWSIKRALLGALTLIAASLAMFVLVFVGPNPAEQLRQNPQYSAQDIERITKANGWDKPWNEQYASWAGRFVQGDWGRSIQTRRPAREMIAERIPVTLLLVGTAQVVAMLIALPLGVFLAGRPGSRVDGIAGLASLTLLATPGFVVALALQMLALKWMHLTGTLPFFTAGGPTEDGVLELVRRYTLPVLSLAILQVAAWSRFQRSESLTAMNADYVRSARAKGLRERAVIARHAFPNTLIPIITILALDIGAMLGGAIVTEVIFDLPGMGTLLLDAVNWRDVVIVLDIAVLAAAFRIFVNAVGEVLYGVVDPKVRVA